MTVILAKAAYSPISSGARRISCINSGASFQGHPVFTRPSLFSPGIHSPSLCKQTWDSLNRSKPPTPNLGRGINQEFPHVGRCRKQWKNRELHSNLESGYRAHPKSLTEAKSLFPWSPQHWMLPSGEWRYTLNNKHTWKRWGEWRKLRIMITSIWEADFQCVLFMQYFLHYISEALNTEVIALCMCR